MSTYLGFGTHLRGFSVRRPDGTHDATEWAVALGMPVVPLRRYNLYIGRTTGTYAAGGTAYVTPFQVVRQTRLRPLEILATYVTWWVVVPAIAVTPIVLLNRYGGDAADEFGSNLLVLGWLVGVPVGILTLSKRIRQLPK